MDAAGRCPGSYLPSNLCFRKSNSAFCIMSVTYGEDQRRSDDAFGRNPTILRSPYFESFERRPHEDDGPHGGDHVVGWDLLHLCQGEAQSAHADVQSRINQQKGPSPPGPPAPRRRTPFVLSTVCRRFPRQKSMSHPKRLAAIS